MRLELLAPRPPGVPADGSSFEATYLGVRRFVRDLAGDPAIICAYIGGSTASVDGDAQSDLDMVVLLSGSGSRAGMALSAQRVARAVHAARSDLAANGGDAANFGMPKVATEGDWASHLWVDPGYGLHVRAGRMVLGSDAPMRRLALPQGRALRHYLLMSFMSRVMRLLHEIRVQLVRTPGRCELRQRYPGYALRFALASTTGEYLLRFPSVLALAVHEFGPPFDLLLRASRSGSGKVLALTEAEALDVGEAFIRLLRSLTGEVVPVRAARTPAFSVEPPALLRLRPPSRLDAAGAAVVVDTVLLDVSGGVLNRPSVGIFSDARAGAWADLIGRLPPRLDEDEAVKVFVFPIDVARLYIEKFMPLAVAHLATRDPANACTRILGLEVDSYALTLRALRVVSYFRYNLLNKWLDFTEPDPRGTAPGELRFRLLMLVAALEALQQLGIAKGSPARGIEAVLWQADDPEGPARCRRSWLDLLEVLPATTEILDDDIRRSLDA